MRTTIDKAGRLVIPKSIRDQLGLLPGEVEVWADGTTLRVEPVSSSDDVVVDDGRPVIPARGVAVDDELVRALRLGGQR